MDSTINTISTTFNTPSKREYSINTVMGRSVDSDSLITGRSEFEKEKEYEYDKVKDIRKDVDHIDESSDSDFSDDDEIAYLRKKTTILNSAHKVVRNLIYSVDYILFA